MTPAPQVMSPSGAVKDARFLVGWANKQAKRPVEPIIVKTPTSGLFKRIRASSTSAPPTTTSSFLFLSSGPQAGHEPNVIDFDQVVVPDKSRFNMADGREANSPPPELAASAGMTPTELPAKGKNRDRLLRGLQRISSSPSIAGLRRSRSVSNPYSTRSRNNLSSASLAATTTPSSARSSTPQPSPLSYPTSYSSVSQSTISEFPFFADKETPASTPLTSPLAVELKPSKQNGQVKARLAGGPTRKPLFFFWDRVPHEIRVHILSFLHPKEIVRASRVSKSFYQYCFDGQLWTSLDASEYYQIIPAASLAKIIVAGGPFIKDLNLRGCVQVEHYKRTEVIVKACKNLMNATLEGCQNFHKNTLHSLLRSNEKLVNLNLTGLVAVSNASCKIIAQSCPQLEALNISWCEKVDAGGVKTVVEGCPRLKDLRVGEIRGFDNLSTAEAIFKTNNLQRLVLTGCAELTDQALKVMMHGIDPEIDILTDQPIVPPRKLRHLDLSRCNRLSDVGVKSLGHLTPDLEGLQLSGCRLLTDAALIPILASTPRLTHLELEDLEELSNTLLSEHLAKAPCANTLEHLSLSSCESLGDVGMLPVMQKCVRLRSVDLDNTRISDLVLAEAAAMVSKRSKRSLDSSTKPVISLQMIVFDCQNVTWTGVREVLFRNAQIKPAAGQSGKVSYPTEIIGLKCFYGFQMTVDEHQKRVLRGDHVSAGRLERKWADYMQANEEAGMLGTGYRRRRRRAREAQALHIDEEEGGYGPNGRRRARTLGSCSSPCVPFLSNKSEKSGFPEPFLGRLKMPLEKIYVTRHGFRSAWHVDPVTGTYTASIRSPTGIPADPALTSHGVDQAEELGRHLLTLDPPVEAVYSSPYYRCLQTITPFVEKHRQQPQNDVAAITMIRPEHGLCEWFGSAPFEHPRPASPEMLKAMFPAFDLDYVPAVTPRSKGESLSQLYERVSIGVRAIIDRCDAEDRRAAVICTHAAVVIALGRILTGEMPENSEVDDFRAFTCGLSVYRRDNAKLDDRTCMNLPADNPAEKLVHEVGGWECELNSDCSFLSSGEERGWKFAGDEEFPSTGSMSQPGAGPKL
ncbi:F-box/LRR-repeat protein 2 [Paramyrothecium foliicola]|nr:F-box/LRR-repeat protein 2 [Paramyrothecium foliicola]